MEYCKPILGDKQGNVRLRILHSIAIINVFELKMHKNRFRLEYSSASLTARIQMGRFVVERV